MKQRKPLKINWLESFFTEGIKKKKQIWLIQSFWKGWKIYWPLRCLNTFITLKWFVIIKITCNQNRMINRVFTRQRNKWFKLIKVTISWNQFDENKNESKTKKKIIIKLAKIKKNNAYCREQTFKAMHTSINFCRLHEKNHKSVSFSEWIIFICITLITYIFMKLPQMIIKKIFIILKN